MDGGLFTPYKAIGVVTNTTPFALNALGTAKFLTVSLGNSFQVLRCDHLSTVAASPTLSRPIRALAVSGLLTYTAVGPDVVVWRKTKRVATLAGRVGAADVALLLVLGDLLLVASGDLLTVWEITATKGSGSAGSKLRTERAGELQLGDGGAPFTASAIAHPPTYLNKVVVGSSEGRLQLWNVRSEKCVHEFSALGSALSVGAAGDDGGSAKRARTAGGNPNLRLDDDDESGAAAVTAIEPSPVLDIAGVGLEDGSVLLVNLRLDSIVMRFRHHGSPSVTSLSFQSNRLVSGCDTGDIAVWDLAHKDGGRLHTVMRSAHHGAVVALAFLAGEPLLISSGADNAVRCWIFDSVDGEPRVLRQREGHAEPPSVLQYYIGQGTLRSDDADPRVCQILTGSPDQTFRVVHTARDAQCGEFSQGKLARRAANLGVSIRELRLPAVTAIAASDTRGRDWSDIVTCHRGVAHARLWSFRRRALAPVVLRCPENSLAGTAMSIGEERRAAATSCTISICGNMAFVGTSRGGVHCFNVQSGRVRRTFYRPSKRKTSSSKKSAHGSAVTGIACGGLNRLLITSAVDGRIRVWRISTGVCVSTIVVGLDAEQMAAVDLQEESEHAGLGNSVAVGVGKLALHRSSALLAAACDDLVIRVWDCSTEAFSSNAGSSSATTVATAENGFAPTLVRYFEGHTGRITDVVWSEDARWIISSAADSSVRVWDVPSSRCVQWMTFEHSVTALALSPDNQYLATAHAHSNGVFLWANRQHFDRVFLEPDPEEPTPMLLPRVRASERGQEDGDDEEQRSEDSDDSMSSEEVEEESDENSADEEKEEDSMAVEDDDVKTNDPEPLSAGLLTLSDAPKSHWATLAVLDLVAKRNKPIEAPKAAPAMPFFLPSDASMNPAFAMPTGNGTGTEAAAATAAADEKAPSFGLRTTEEATLEVKEAASKEAEDARPASRILTTIASGGGLQRSTTVFSQIIGRLPGPDVEDDVDVDIEETMLSAAVHLRSLKASGIDIAIRSLSLGAEDDDAVPLLLRALDFWIWMLERRSSFQLAQATLALFVKVHEEQLANCGKTKEPDETVEEDEMDEELVAAMEAARLEIASAVRERIVALHAAQRATWLPFQAQLHQNLGLLAYLMKIQ